MDLALAKLVEGRLQGGGRLDAAQYGMLTQACRNAKEKLLEKDPPESFTVSVMGRGRQVVGGSLHASLTPADVREAIFDGFFPYVAKDAEPARGARSGLHEMGLPYVSDPAVTRIPGSSSCAGTHQQADDAGCALGCAFFSMGEFSSHSRCRVQLVEVMRRWSRSSRSDMAAIALTNPSLDLAVAWGLPRTTPGCDIAGRPPHRRRSRARLVLHRRRARRPEADTPGKEAETSVLCVVPQHWQEGQEVSMAQPELELALGQPVRSPCTRRLCGATTKRAIF